MADRNWLFLGAGEAAPRLVSTTGEAATLGPDTAPPAEVWVPLPMEEVSLFRVQTPLRGTRLAKAIPFFLEERLADELDGLHFAWDPAGEGAVVAAAITKARMGAWMDRLAGLGVARAHLVPEVYLLPYEPGTWSLLIDGERALLRTATDAGCAFTLDALVPVLAALIGDADAPPSLHVYATAAAKARIPWAELPGLSPALFEAEIGPAWYATHADPRGLDLCQGEFARRDPWVERMRAWIAPAALLLVWLAVGSLQSGLEVQRLQAENEALGAEMARIFREAFPEIKRVVDPSTQMRNAVARLGTGGSTDVWPFLDALATALAEGPGWRLSTLRYRKDTLEAGVEVPSLAALERLRDGIARAGGFKVEMSAVTPEKERVTSRLVIKR